MAAPQLMDADTVAGLLGGISTRQLSRWVEQGLPTVPDGRKRLYDWPAVLEWYVDFRASTPRKGARSTTAPEGAEDEKSAARRLATYNADLKRLTLDQRRGELVPMADVTRTLQDVATGLRTEILGLPTRIVDAVAGYTDQTERHTYLTTECELLCTRLAQLRFEPKADTTHDDDADRDLSSDE